MQKEITRAQAEAFYAEAYAICHSPRLEDGRTFSLAASNHPISSAFHITTPHGLLEVGVVRPEWRSLGYSIYMRFMDRPAICPEVGGLYYSQQTGKWGLYGSDSAKKLAELSARLDWAQGRQTAPRTKETQVELALA